MDVVTTRFEPITPDVIPEIEPWFEDSETQRYLGDKTWLHRTLTLLREAPGVQFRGRRVLARHVWVVREAGHAVALVDVEPYDDGTAGVALVVAPWRRGQGVGRRILRMLDRQAELSAVACYIGAIEAGNAAAKGCVVGAGFEVAEEEDEEGMLRISRRAA